MKSLINKILDYQIKNNCIKKSEKTTYEYAYTILIEECINIVIAFTIAIAFGNTMLVFFFLCSYIPLRRFAGGYHADDGFICGIVSSILIIILCLLSKLGVDNLIQKGKYMILIICQVCIFTLAPVDTANKRLDEYERQKNRKIVAKILIVQMISVFVGAIGNSDFLLGGIIYSHIVLNCMLLIGIYKNYIHRQEGNLNNE